MGGIVAQLVVALDNHNRWNLSDIAAIITMSAPHSLAPARLDTKIERIYRDISLGERSREHDIPVLSICGGSTDSQIVSETCALPATSEEHQARHRRTVYTTSVPGVWTGVGHREIVWCHQVRWRVARAALDVGNAGNDPTSRSGALFRWFPSLNDTLNLTAPSNSIEGLPPLESNRIPFTLVTSTTLRVSRPGTVPHVYLMPVPFPSTRPQTFSLLIARGSVVAPPLDLQAQPHQPGSFAVSVSECFADEIQVDDPASSSCKPLGKGLLDSRLVTYSSHLLPLPLPESDFPGEEGVDESDSLIYFRASFRANDSGPMWIAIRVEGGSDIAGQEWLTAGFDQEREYEARNGSFGRLCTASAPVTTC